MKDGSEPELARPDEKWGVQYVKLRQINADRSQQARERGLVERLNKEISRIEGRLARAIEQPLGQVSFDFNGWDNLVAHFLKRRRPLASFERDSSSLGDELRRASMAFKGLSNSLEIDRAAAALVDEIAAGSVARSRP